jgi:ubiquitin-conjugating enzyme E2 H
MVSINNKRKERDLMKLMMSNYDVTVIEDSKPFDFYVKFNGPKESAYEGVNRISFNFRGLGKST